MKAIRKQRLWLAFAIMAAAAASVGLVLFALGQNINLFFTPTQIAAGEAPLNKTIRAGGLVVLGSVKRATDSLQVEFKVTDNSAEIPIFYEGILPDLFREGQGIVAIGQLDNTGRVNASQVLAKHDENYTPPEVLKAIEAAGHPGASAEP